MPQVVALFTTMINDTGDDRDLPTAIGCSRIVDDLAIRHPASSARHMTRQLKLAVTHLVKWSQENVLRFSTTHIVAVHFCHLDVPTPI